MTNVRFGSTVKAASIVSVFPVPVGITTVIASSGSTDCAARTSSSTLTHQLEVNELFTRLADEADDVVPKPYERGRAAMEAYLAWEEALDYEGVSPVRLVPEAR